MTPRDTSRISCCGFFPQYLQGTPSETPVSIFLQELLVQGMSSGHISRNSCWKLIQGFLLEIPLENACWYSSKKHLLNGFKKQLLMILSKKNPKDSLRVLLGIPQKVLLGIPVGVPSGIPVWLLGFRFRAFLPESSFGYCFKSSVWEFLHEFHLDIHPGTTSRDTFRISYCGFFQEYLLGAPPELLVDIPTETPIGSFLQELHVQRMSSLDTSRNSCSRLIQGFILEIAPENPCWDSSRENLLEDSKKELLDDFQ